MVKRARSYRGLLPALCFGGRLAPIRHCFGRMARRGILGENITHEHCHGLVRYEHHVHLDEAGKTLPRLPLCGGAVHLAGRFCLGPPQGEKKPRARRGLVVRPAKPARPCAAWAAYDAKSRRAALLPRVEVGLPAKPGRVAGRAPGLAPGPLWEKSGRAARTGRSPNAGRSLNAGRSD